MRIPMTGGCPCGAIRYEIRSEPSLTYVCHCTDCQRRSGSAFAVSLVVPDAAFAITAGDPVVSTRVAESGNTVSLSLCGACGGPVFAGRRGGPRGTLTVRAGTLDDTGGVRPDIHIWTRSRQPWVAIPNGVPSFGTRPPVPVWEWRRPVAAPGKGR